MCKSNVLSEASTGSFFLGPLIEGDNISGKEIRASLGSADLLKWERLRVQLHSGVLAWLLLNEPYRTLTIAVFVKTTLDLFANYPNLKSCTPGAPKQVLTHQVLCLPEAKRESRVTAVNLALVEATLGFDRCPLINIHFKLRKGSKRVDFDNKAGTFYHRWTKEEVRSMLERQGDNGDVFCCIVCGLIHKALEGMEERFQVPHLLWQPVCSWCNMFIVDAGAELEPPQVTRLVHIRKTSATRLMLLTFFSGGVELGMFSQSCWNFVAVFVSFEKA